ncbi:MAG: UDP-N-acetylmuramate dehydrogenase [Synergistales bacterium]|nr:UDP-N-acetylmuramate dehydrogenase [Synergistales bacterium]
MKKALSRLLAAEVPVVEGESLKRHCTWRIGGPADLFIEPRSVEEIRLTVEILNERGLPWVVIGRGSNLLFDDQGVRGAVIKLGRAFSQVSFDGETVRGRAGVWIPSLARRSAFLGLSGLEHMVGIPGTLGGVIAMNGGSLRQNIGQVVDWVTYMDREGTVHRLDGSGCGFSYRSSCFQDSSKVVLEAQLSLKRSSSVPVREEMVQVLKERKAKFPLSLPNCGSVFSNDPEIHREWGPPGKVVETCGLKGLRIGDAKVSEKHANFIVNLGEATSVDVMSLIRVVRRVIHDVTGREIPCEVRYVSPSGWVVALHKSL